MNRLSPDSISRVKEQADIVQVIGEYVRLRKTGPQFTGICPFHTEHTASLKVTPANGVPGFFNCFGCNTGGGVIDFVMQIEGLTFPDALRSLAERFGVPLDDKPIPKAQLDMARRLAEEAAYFWTAYRARLVRLIVDTYRAEREASRAMLPLLESGERHRSEEWIWFWAVTGPEIAEALDAECDWIDEATPKSLIAEYRRLCAETAGLQRWCRRRVVERREFDAWVTEMAKRKDVAA